MTKVKTDKKYRVWVLVEEFDGKVDELTLGRKLKTFRTRKGAEAYALRVADTMK